MDDFLDTGSDMCVSAQPARTLIHDYRTRLHKAMGELTVAASAKLIDYLTPMASSTPSGLDTFLGRARAGSSSAGPARDKPGKGAVRLSRAGSPPSTTIS